MLHYGSTPRRCFGKPGLISRGIMMEAASGCVGCVCGGKPRREFHHICHTFQSVRVCVCVCRESICVAPWCIQPLTSRERDIQSIIVRNVEGGRGRGTEGNWVFLWKGGSDRTPLRIARTVFNQHQANICQNE